MANSIGPNHQNTKTPKHQNTILVTGGAGFIGSNLVGALLGDDRVDKVRILDNLATGFGKICRSLRFILSLNFSKEISGISTPASKHVKE
jgi:FlaA1/EpsC-like NDP-sugar epimerase